MRVHLVRIIVALIACTSTITAQDTGRGTGDILLKDYIIHDATGKPPYTGSILVRAGKIVAVGAVDEIPAGIQVVDGNGELHACPGIIDCHSHIAISGGLNESTGPVTPEVRLRDAVNHEDRSIYRALAGGCTMAHLLHGSANIIGGQDAVIKLRWGCGPDELLFDHAPRGVKFALGENPKRSNSSGNRPQQGYPRSRMGVEQIIRRAFTDARAYQAGWKRHAANLAAGKRGVPPRRDLRLEALVDMLEGDIKIHCHCYRADEILMLLRVADEFGIKIQTLQHVLEGYKVADEIAAHRAGASTFADWWAYKIEAFDAIPYNAEIMRRHGVVVSINSDSGDHIRRLNLEAAKAVKYGGYPELEAIQLVTRNPAIQLGIDEWVGTLEVGKDADIAVFNRSPLDSASICNMTLIEGRIYFERKNDLEERRGIDRVLAGQAEGDSK